MNPNDADIKKMQADIYYSAGRWDSALSIYLQLVEASPKNEKFNLRTGELFQKTYKWKSSIAYLNAYLEQQPKNAEVQKKLGIAYFYSEEYTQAINLFESAAQTLWNDKDLMLYTSIACNKQENYTKALKYTRRAIALDSHYARAYYQEGVAYRGLKRNKESKQSFEKTKELGLNSMEP
jgi:tetratricopeptide (TPR) repeat protein